MSYNKGEKRQTDSIIHNAFESQFPIIKYSLAAPAATDEMHSHDKIPADIPTAQAYTDSKGTNRAIVLSSELTLALARAHKHRQLHSPSRLTYTGGITEVQS